MAKGHGHYDQCDIFDALPSLNNQEPNMERNSVVVVPIDRVQTYPELVPCKTKKELNNWRWVRLGNPRAKINDTDIAEQKHWQKHYDNNDNREFDRTGDNAESESVEGDQIHSEASKERPGRSLKGLE